jgi:hypothetical protein
VKALKRLYRNLIAFLADPVVKDLAAECNRFEAENIKLVAENVRRAQQYHELERTADWQRRELDVQEMTIGTLRDEVRQANSQLSPLRRRLQLVPTVGRVPNLDDVAQEKRYEDGLGD